MSYSVTMGPWAQSEFTADRVREAVEAEQAKVAERYPDQADAMADQAEKLVEAIPVLVGGIGPDDAAVYVAVSGHANADHTPTGDWAPDAYTISLSHSVRQPAVDPDA